MKRKRTAEVGYQILEFAGVRYAVLPEAELQALAADAKRAVTPTPGASASPQAATLTDLALGREPLGTRLAERRKQAGITQASLAVAAGVRVETLNRIERGHCEPDFKTVRKVVLALDALRSGASTMHSNRTKQDSSTRATT